MQPIDRVRQMLLELVGGPDTPFAERRAASKEFEDSFTPPPGLSIARDALGGVPVEWIVPDNASPAHVFFHLHGGGYVLGSPAGARPLTTEFALRARCRVASVDYRLAPEHPFPAAVEDGVAAWRGLLDAGTHPKDVVFGGDSAGGGLTLAVLIAARDVGLPMPAAAFAISPWTDMRCEAETFRTLAASDPLLTARSLKEMADAYLAGADPKSPLASPALADLSGLPPLLIHVGADEVLLDDTLALQKRAMASGVDARFKVWPHMIHVWHMFHPMLPEGSEAINELVAFTRAHWDK
jgi:acetyl esterase/lipase